MAKEIRVDTEALQQAAKQYKKAAYLLDGDDGKTCSNNSVFGQLHLVINEIDGKWEGKACDEFVRRLKNELTEISKLAQTMRDMQTCCNRIVEVYKKADRAVLPTINNPIAEEAAYATAYDVTRKTGKKRGNT